MLRPAQTGPAVRGYTAIEPRVGALGVVLLGLTLLAAVFAGCGVVAQPEPAPENCGAVSLRVGDSPGSGDATRAESCFYQAYLRCAPVTLAANEMGVDSGVDRTFSAQPDAKGGCAVTDTVDSYVVPTRHNNSVTYACAGVSQRDNGLLFLGCGADGDFLVPADTASPGATPSS